MNKLTCLFLSLAVAAAFGVAKADTITVKRSGESTAKVECVPSKGMSTSVPICFENGADWDSVKDSYNVSSETAHALKSGKDCIVISKDGAARFSARSGHTKHSCKKACKKSCKAKKKK